jgi:Meiotically Up-regulated Gene 113 (MUG113) protein
MEAVMQRRSSGKILNSGSRSLGSRPPIYARKGEDQAIALIDALDRDDPAYKIVMVEIVRLRRYVDDITEEMVARVIQHARERAAREAEESREVSRLTGRNMPTPTVTSPVVYYARIADQVKIGMTTSIAARMASLGAEELLATEPGGFDVEKMRHRQFHGLHLRGEWFRLEAPLTSHIEELRSNPKASGG